MTVGVPSFQQIKREKLENEFIQFFNSGYGPTLADVPGVILGHIQSYLAYKDKKALRLVCKALNSLILPHVERKVTVSMKMDRCLCEDIYHVVRSDKRRLNKEKWNFADFAAMGEESILNVARLIVHSSKDLKCALHTWNFRNLVECRSYTPEIFGYAQLLQLRILELPVTSLREVIHLPFRNFTHLERLVITYCGPPCAENNDLIFELLKANLHLPSFQFRYGGFDVVSSHGGEKEAMNHEQLLQIVDLYYVERKKGTVCLPRMTLKERAKVAENFKQHSDVWQFESKKWIFDIRLGRGKYLTVNLEEQHRKQTFVTFRIRVVQQKRDISTVHAPLK